MDDLLPNKKPYIPQVGKVSAALEKLQGDHIAEHHATCLACAAFIGLATQFSLSAALSF